MGGAAAQQQDRDVVLAAVAVDGVAEPVGQLLQVPRAVHDECGEPLHALVEVGAREFDESVGEQDHRLARVEFHGRDRVLQPPELRREAQGQPALGHHPAAGAVHVPHHRVDMVARTTCTTPVVRSASA